MGGWCSTQRSAVMTLNQRKSIKEQVLQGPPPSHLFFNVSLAQETQTLGSIK